MAPQGQSTIKILVSDPIHNSGERASIEYARYQKIVDTIARPGTTLDFTSLKPGYFTSRGTAYPDAVNAIGIAEKAYEAEKRGYDAFIIGCVWDIGLKEARSLVKIPVAAPTESSALLACTLGRKFSVIASHYVDACKYRDMIQRYGFGDRLASVRYPPGFIAGNGFKLIFGGEKEQIEFTERVTAEMRKAVEEDSAEVVWYACTLGTTLLTMHGVHEVDGAIVIDAFVAALKMAEIMVDMQRAYGTSVCRASIYQSPKPGWEKERPIASD